ncbi:MAG: hypothetical protein A3H98_05595 [Bacteroidetes bacterium RIFCSPLOWO2_02_FULL_36_8]|nr:MAG: hypothetical protein A3H98_05595 [Bacteroidetes bacterium RIFCSPLOWO2_02_FULL_36_8]
MHFSELEKLILDKLSKELPRNLYYHGVHHTRGVLSAVSVIAREEKVNEKELNLLMTAALFHDTGFLIKYYDNEGEGAKLAGKLLPSYGFEKADIEIICQLIMATSIPQQPVTLLEKTLCDADLDYLGRDDFFSISHDLRREWNEYGKPHTLLEWYEQQVVFMNKHSYFTATAKRLRVEKKQKHVDEITLLLSSSNKIFKKVQETETLKRILDKTHIISIDTIQILKNIELFTASSDKVLSDISSLLKILQIQKNEIIIRKGEPGNCMYIIYEGTVKVHDDIYTIAELGTGKFFGELSLLDTEPRSASVTAITNCTLLRLDQDDFYAIFRKYNEVAREIMKVLINRLRSQNTSIVNEFKTRERKLR